MKYLVKFLMGTACLTIVFGGIMPQNVSAQTAADTAALSQQVKLLLQQVQSLQTRIGELDKQRGGLVKELAGVRKELRLQLREGTQNTEVETLQEFLAQFPDLYPEGKITGYYGLLTKKAVMKFQQKHGIDSLGEVGPRTRAKINELFASGAGDSGKFPPGLSKKFDIQGTSTVQGPHVMPWKLGSGSAATHPGMGKALGKEEIIICHKPGTPAAKSLKVATPAAVVHIGHGDKVGLCALGDIPREDDEDDDDDDNNGTTTPDTTAPTVSGIMATGTMASSASIIWTTDEASNSTVTYGTTTPLVSASGTLMTTNSMLVTSHAISLSSLSASTTYYYSVTSKDVANNIATSSESSFMTLP